MKDYIEIHLLCSCSVSQGYAAKVGDADLRHLVPATLHEDPSILFTNVNEIHEFHAG